MFYFQHFLIKSIQDLWYDDIILCHYQAAPPFVGGYSTSDCNISKHYGVASKHITLDIVHLPKIICTLATEVALHNKGLKKH